MAHDEDWAAPGAQDSEGVVAGDPESDGLMDMAGAKAGGFAIASQTLPLSVMQDLQLSPPVNSAKSFVGHHHVNGNCQGLEEKNLRS